MEQKQKRKCHFSQHLGGSAFVVYSVLSNLIKSRGMSEISIGSRRLASYTVYDKNTICRALNALVAAGWIERFPASSRGRYQPNTFTLLGHDDWAAEHPGQCDHPVPVFGTGD